jgi:hypothetical protein
MEPRLTAVGGSAALARDTLLSAKVGSEMCRQAAVVSRYSSLAD